MYSPITMHPAYLDATVPAGGMIFGLQPNRYDALKARWRSFMFVFALVPLYTIAIRASYYSTLVHQQPDERVYAGVARWLAAGDAIAWCVVAFLILSFVGHCLLAFNTYRRGVSTIAMTTSFFGMHLPLLAALFYKTVEELQTTSDITRILFVNETQASSINCSVVPDIQKVWVQVDRSTTWAYGYSTSLALAVLLYVYLDLSFRGSYNNKWKGNLIVSLSLTVCWEILYGFFIVGSMVDDWWDRLWCLTVLIPLFFRWLCVLRWISLIHQDRRSSLDGATCLLTAFEWLSTPVEIVEMTLRAVAKTTSEKCLKKNDYDPLVSHEH